VPENAGKHPKSGLLLRLENTTDNFKESPIPIIDRKHDSANLISYRKPIFQRFATIAIRSQHAIMSHATSNAALATLSGDTLTDPTTPRNPVHYIQRHTRHAHGPQHDTHGRHELGHSMSLRNLLLYGRPDGSTPLPCTAQRAKSQSVKPLSIEKHHLYAVSPLPRKTPYFPLSPSFVLCSYADLC
jgi:hypothetical protein